MGPLSLRIIIIIIHCASFSLICESREDAAGGGYCNSWVSRHFRDGSGGAGAILSVPPGDWRCVWGGAKYVTSDLFLCGNQQERVPRRRPRDPCLPLCCRPQWSAPHTWLSSGRGACAAWGGGETGRGRGWEEKSKGKDKGRLALGGQT